MIYTRSTNINSNSPYAFAMNLTYALLNDEVYQSFKLNDGLCKEVVWHGQIKAHDELVARCKGWMENDVKVVTIEKFPDGSHQVKALI